MDGQNSYTPGVAPVTGPNGGQVGSIYAPPARATPATAQPSSVYNSGFASPNSPSPLANLALDNTLSRPDNLKGESLDAKAEGEIAKEIAHAPPATHNSSRRKAILVSAIITLLVLLGAGFGTLLLSKYTPKDNPSTQRNAVPSQDISLSDADQATVPDEIQDTAYGVNPVPKAAINFFHQSTPLLLANFSLL